MVTISTIAVSAVFRSKRTRQERSSRARPFNLQNAGGAGPIFKFQHEFHGFLEKQAGAKYVGYLNETLHGETASERLGVRASSDGTLTYEMIEEWFDSHVIKTWKFEQNYMLSHKRRWIETVLLCSRHVARGSRVLFLGEYGHMAYFFWRAFGVIEMDLVIGEFESVVPMFAVTRNGLIHTQEQVSSTAAAQGDYVLGPIKAQQCNTELLHSRSCDNLKQTLTPTGRKYDIVVAFEVLEHMERHPMRAVHLAHDALADGGRFIVTVPSSSSYVNILKMITHRYPALYQGYTGCGVGVIQHPREYAINELQQLMVGGGFQVDYHRTFSPYLRQHIDYDDDMVPGLRRRLLHHGMVEIMSGQGHFIVSKKVKDRKQFKCVRWLYMDQEEGSVL